MLGGSLANVARLLNERLAAGETRLVLDNTYPTRKSRNEVIEIAWARGAAVRCVWLTTNVANAQINCVRRMLDAHGSLPMPHEIRRLGKSDPRYLLPDALFRYERALEPPTLEEGFTSIETRDFVRETKSADGRALILDFDDLMGRDSAVLDPAQIAVDDERRDALLHYRAEGWRNFVHAWRPQVERKEITLRDVESCFASMRKLLGDAIDIACCPHDAGPPVCWCRKPIPGSVLEFAVHRGVDLTRSIVVGKSAADKTMAERIGARFASSASFFGITPGS
jgi:histidinol phosphatase-like enzyme